ncbi:plastocyanin/azurin family copper-binding protein [Rhodococcus sp. HNM0569]|uniref:cupredoxin domain-containing protein n=1 Tax=Rhodococcus sp. HNM0569 TaxID=2716340 RepID=UPI00146DB634|nr:plastocyanin/azurin family copper-binding protein [Rhodococcus sp. HNM0569]NLU82628.1 biphenyl 2,3-dioxygenase [Rhodococcus sp. HNM0569]
MRRLLCATVLFALVTCPAACGSTDSAADATIVIGNVAFTPHHVTIPAGGTVEWRFEDGGVLHHVRSVGGADGGTRDEFDSGITGDGTFAHTFHEAGTYEYSCSVHPYMVGTVTVTAS